MQNKDNCLNNTNKNNDAINSLSSCFFSLPPTQFTLLATLIGLLFIENLDLNQQNSLGNFFVSVGSSILVGAAQGQLLEANKNDKINEQIDSLKKQIHDLEQELD